MARVTLNGINVHYVDTGVPAGADPSAPPLVLVHGLGCSSLDWDFQLPALSPHHRLIAPCLRGFGESDKPRGPLAITDFAADLCALLDHLEVASAHVLGFSMGGAVALQAGGDSPQRIASLIIVNSQPSFELDHWRKHLMKVYRIGMASVLGMERMTRLLTRQCFPLPEQRELREEMLRRHRLNDKPSYLAAIQALAGWSVVPRLGDLSAPVLVVSGELDYVPVSERERYTQMIPKARLEVIEDSRHATPFDQPEVFNRLVLEFLREIASTAPAADADDYHMRSSGMG